MPSSAKLTLIPLRPVTGVLANLLDFDQTTQRVRDRRGQAIRHPKESAAEALTDDVMLEPVVLQITAHFTDHPLYYGPNFGGFEGRAEQQAQAVRAIQDAKERCIVLFGDEIFTSMIVESVSEPRTAQTGDAADLDITIVHVEVGDLLLVAALVDAATQALGDIDAIDVGWLP